MAKYVSLLAFIALGVIILALRSNGTVGESASNYIFVALLAMATGTGLLLASRDCAER